MSDQSDREDDMPSDGSDIPSEQDSHESETDQGDEFFDLEADESDGFDEDEEDEYDRHADDGEHFSFPQFSRLPPELRAMIWEAVDPHLKSQGRVLDFHVVIDPVDLWESAILSQQTAPARTLLAATRESRCIALQHYPDAIQIRLGFGEVRFNSSKDIILLHRAHRLPDIGVIGRWCDKIKYLAFEYERFDDPSDDPDVRPDLTTLPQKCKSVEAVFFCFEADMLRHRDLDWSVGETSKQFYINLPDVTPLEILYCWPDTKLHANFAERVGKDYMLQFPYMPTAGSIPIWPMAQFISDSAVSIINRVRRRRERNLRREAGSTSPVESSDSSEEEYFDDSELDDYVADDFVVTSTSEESEEEVGNSEDLSDENGYEGDVQLDQGLDVFIGFSPLQQEPSDDEGTGNLPNATILNHDLESGDHNLSDAQSPQEQPRPTTQTGRHKRYIVSSDDGEDGGNGGEGSTAPSHSRVKKRSRVVLSDSEGDEDRSENGAGYEAQGPSRLKKRARIVPSDSEDDEEGDNPNEGHKPPGYRPDENEDEDDEDEEERPASKPVSLLARLRQFRSDVPVSPEGESSNSAETWDEEQEYEDDEERRLSDAEFPESAAEDDEENGW
ncbi:hypothetical protein F5Y12DRAFT_697024 [Xylaria sp. FL1777]|nr:hypothetical protein F5Y12DRAFT_697024 [Xylaria sp. FL1777]